MVAHVDVGQNQQAVVLWDALEITLDKVTDLFEQVADVPPSDT